MPPNFGLATQEWRLEDSDSDSDLDIKPDPLRHKTEGKPVLYSRAGETKGKPVLPSSAGETARKPVLPSSAGETARKPVLPSSAGETARRAVLPSSAGETARRAVLPSSAGETARRAVLPSSAGEPVATENVDESPDNIGPEQPPLSTTKPQVSTWSRWDIWKYMGVLAVTSAVIWGFPLVEESSPPGSKSQPTSIPRNIFQSHTVGLAKLDISALDIACRGSQLPICGFTQPLRNLDLTSNDQEVDSLGYDLGVLLRPTKMATSEEECAYFLQLQIDINEAWDRTLQIQDALKIGLDSIHQALSLITDSRINTAEVLTSMDEDANGEMWKIGTRHGQREKAYRDNKRWLEIFDDYTRKLESRAVAWDWELGRQNRLQKDLKEVEKQIKGLRIGGEPDSADSCTAFNMQRVERRLLDTIMRATENDATAESLSKYYSAL